VPTDKCYELGGNLICGERFYAKLISTGIAGGVREGKE
jgi:hypothetical protein